MNNFKLFLFTLFIGSSGALFFVLLFLNLIIAAWLWPESITQLGTLLNKQWHPTWYFCALIGMIPFFGRWYMTILVWAALQMLA